MRVFPILHCPRRIGWILLGWGILGMAQKNAGDGIVIPKTWDDAEMASVEIPLAYPAGSPKHVPAEYYYRIPVRPIYKQYPVYAPGREPKGYWEWLQKQQPVVLWDDANKHPPLRTAEDWIKAGEIAFEAPIAIGILGYHLKTGHTLSVQNRPTGVAEDVIVLPCLSVRVQGAD